GDQLHGTRDLADVADGLAALDESPGLGHGVLLRQQCSPPRVGARSPDRAPAPTAGLLDPRGGRRPAVGAGGVVRRPRPNRGGAWARDATYALPSDGALNCGRNPSIASLSCCSRAGLSFLSFSSVLRTSGRCSRM